MNGDWAVLLLAHGAPDRLEDVPAFVLSLRDGRPLADSALQEIVERYRMIGGGSPLLALTRRQAAALDRRLGHRVYVGMRNWRPYIADAIRQAHQEGARHVVALCLAPQNSRTSVGLYRKVLDEAIERLAPGLEADFIESWHDHPGLIVAFRERIAAALDRAGPEAGVATPVIFTAHSVPERTIAAGDPYDQQVRETARLIAKALGPRLDEWRVAYQSQGMTADPWIGPTVESQIDALAAAGHRRVVIAPIGFVCDHVEILYDIDIVFRKYGESRGVEVSRSESLNEGPLFIEALATLIMGRARLGA
ncbi:MAG TPA: ferrochelatase [Terriglobia bacterium]|nr:ferrochelatase [Terriglobia bacterium]